MEQEADIADKICRTCPFWNEEYHRCCRTPVVAIALEALYGSKYSGCELFEDAQETVG